MANKYSTKIIIIFHPTGELLKDGSLSFNDKGNYLDAFTESAQNHGVEFINMTNAFLEMYRTEHHVAHGFVTGNWNMGI